MREDNPSETRAKTSKFADQNRIPKGHQNQTMKGNKNSSKLRSASTWGSQIVRGFSGDKKSMKKPLMESDIMNQNNSLVPSHSRVKRSLITDLSCSTNSNQVHPKTIQFQTHKRQSSRDLFVELDQLRNLLQESKNREFKLQAELSECKRNPRVLELERELVEKKTKIEGLLKKVELLEEEKTILSDQFLTKNEDPMPTQNLEVEVVELRRLNKDLQLQKRNIALRLSSVQSQLSSLAMASESDTVAKIKAEASMLRYTNEDLSKQVEDLQMSRLNEVEELAYLRWVNSCLRNELRSSCSTINATEKLSSNSSTEKRGESADSCLSSFKNECLDYDGAKSPNSVNKLSKWSLPDEDLHDLEGSDDVSVDTDQMSCPRRRHSMSGSKCSAEGILPYKRRQSDGFIITKEMHNKEEFLPSNTSQLHMKSLETNNKLPSYFDVEKRALRIPNPPPKPSCIISCGNKEERYTQIHPPPLPPPPPPPPPIQKLSERSNIGAVQRAPQVVEFYHSLMKRDSRKDSSNGGICDASDVAGVRSSMIGEIENRSSHLLAIKADIETQGEFVNSLIREVNNAAYQNIEDVVAFVQWLDDELCFLVDERAVLKHFDWPERKADTLREAAFGYRDLKLLESEVSSFKDDLRLPYDIALKKMVALFEKMERIVYNLFRTRELLMRNCKEFHIPTEWMLDNGAINKIRIGSVKLAKLYMKRVAMELQSKVSFEKDHALDYVLLQGVRFAFRIHQFAGGFDAETMHAFEELRMLANVLNNK